MCDREKGSIPAEISSASHPSLPKHRKPWEISWCWKLAGLACAINIASIKSLRLRLQQGSLVANFTFHWSLLLA